jgi:GTP:adenosylcobinamide-phosphate guanylyltransferase
LTAAITAGGRVDGALAAAMGTDVKALADVGNGKLIDHAIEAARAAGARRVTVIGNTEVRAHCAARVDAVIDASPDGRENLRHALEAGADGPLLLMSSDLPFITGDATTDFIARAAPSDLALPLASELAYVRTYPGAPNHVTALGNSRVANGSIVYFGPGIAPRVLDVAQRLFTARKSLWRMAMLLGPQLLARFALGKLEIEHVERRAERVFGIRARAVSDASPALCYDIDTLDDYRYAVRHLAAS